MEPFASEHGAMSVGGELTPSPALEERLEHLRLEFLAEFLGQATRRHPDNFDALVELATVLTRLGRYQEGLEADERLVGLAPGDPTVHYNLACSLALLGRVEPAFAALERAIELGYGDGDQLAHDADLENLRALPRFQVLVERLRASG